MTSAKVDAEEGKASPVTQIKATANPHNRVGIWIDTRNSDATGVGSFEGRSIQALTVPVSYRIVPNRPSCTIEIRWEKVSSYLERQGFMELHHLHYRILKYLE